MSTFANVNVGAVANDGSGDPIRNAFEIINENFSNLANGSGSGIVTSVAGRNGNVVLTINDVAGAASIYYVANYVAAGNAYVDSQVAALGNIDVVALSMELDALDANVGSLSNAIDLLNSNAASQSDSLTVLASDVNALNSEFDTHDTEINNLNSNVFTLTSTVTTHSTKIDSLIANAATQALSINDISSIITTYGEDITGANIAIDNINLAWQANAASLYDYIQDNTTDIGILYASLTLANAHIQSTNANLSLFETYANLQAQSTSGTIQTITANIGSYYNYANLTFSTVGNAASQQAQINSLLSQAYANVVLYLPTDPSIVAINSNISAIQANLGSYYSYANLTYSTIADVIANASIQETEITNLRANVTASNLNVSALQSTNSAYQTWANTNISGLTANVGAYEAWANVHFGTSTYSNSNVIAYLAGASITTLGNLSGGNLITSGGTIINTGIQTSGNILASNIITVAGTILNSGLQTSGNVVAGTVITAGGTLLNSGLQTTGNVVSGNVIVTGRVYSSGNVAMTSNVARYTWVANVAPTSSQGSVGDIWYQTF